MSAVTKVLVVLLSVLCVAFSMVAIQFVATSDNWKSLSEGYRVQAQVANAGQRSLMASHAAELAASRDAIQASSDRVNDLAVELQSAKDGLARRDGELTQVVSEKRQADVVIQRLTNELSIAQKGRESVESQRGQLESRNIELERRNIDLNERVNELTTQVTVLTRQARQQAQQLAMLRNESKLTPVGGGSTGGHGLSGSVQALSPHATPHISGHVVAVDDKLVTVSVGSSDRVDSGSVFVVFRGSEYIGDVEITDVEPNLSAGRLIRLGSARLPEVGDKVEDEYHFAQPR